MIMQESQHTIKDKWPVVLLLRWYYLHSVVISVPSWLKLRAPFQYPNCSERGRRGLGERVRGQWSGGGSCPPLHPTDQSGSYLRVHTEDSWPMAWFVCCLGWAEHSHTFWPWRGHGGERLVRTCQCITVLSTKGNFFRPESGQHFIDGS